MFRGQGFFIREIISMHDHEVVRLPPVSAARFRACRAKSGQKSFAVLVREFSDLQNFLSFSSYPNPDLSAVVKVPSLV